jgi:hypothetical protein
MSTPQIPTFRAATLSDARRTTLERFYGALATRNFDLVDDALTEHWEDTCAGSAPASVITEPA